MIQAAQLLLSLSFLILLHELGHFIPAKLFKTRVEKFYLFFDPWFELFKYKKGDTEYGIGWLPLGGYVKISGMIDESVDTEQMKSEPQPWEFRAKPAWQRLIIMAGGVTVNFILGILIFSIINLAWGKDKVYNVDVKQGIGCGADSTLLRIGLRDGDCIIGIDNKYPAEFNAIQANLVINMATSVQVLREGKQLSFPITKEDIGRMMSAKKSMLLPRFEMTIEKFADESNAKFAGLMAGDQIVGVNNVDAKLFPEISRQLYANKGKKVPLKIKRGNEIITKDVQISTDGTIGIQYKKTKDNYKISHVDYSFASAFSQGWADTKSTIIDNVRQYKIIFTVPGAHKQVGGFVAFAQAFDTTWDWQSFWHLTGLISLILAFMNLLPIPALDGGHIMFTLYEIITRRKPSEKFLLYSQYVGMIILFGLFLFAQFNDIFRRILGFE